MKAVTYRLTPETEHYGRVGKFFHDRAIWVVAIHNVDVLADGTAVIQFEVAEAPSRLHTILAATPDWIHDYQVAEGEDRPILQLHFEPGGVHREILALHHASPVVLEYPLRVVDHEAQSFRVTMVGPENGLRTLIEETRETVDVTIEHVGEYEAVVDTVVDELTDRQQLVLRTAVKLGYYDEPRNVTHEDIARDLDCSASAVGQHLRRVEQTVMSEIISESGQRDAGSFGAT